jgi:hypothetical protein
LCQQIVPDRELDFLPDSHVKLDILVDTQERFTDGHHKVALDYDKVRRANSLHIGHISLQQLRFLCWERIHSFLNTNAIGLRLIHLDLITMGQKSRFLNKNHS